MSAIETLSKIQTMVSAHEVEIDTVLLRLRSPAARRHAIRAAGMIEAVVREAGAALHHERQLAAAEAPLTFEVTSPGADRVDALVREIPADVCALTDRVAAHRIGARDDAAGARLVADVFRRNGWERRCTGWWHRSAAAPTPGRSR